MSIARHHAEWLSLVPVSGPFLSMPVLLEAFNTGLEPHDPDQTRLLRQEYANWEESFEKRRADPTPHQHWIKIVLGRTLELDDRMLLEGQAIPQTLQAEMPVHSEFLRPSVVVCDPVSRKPRMLVQTYPRSQELTSYVANSNWKASPDTRMTELLHATNVRLGLVTNGEHWMLVDAPKGGTTGYASWYAYLWLDEPITLRAFRSLLSANRFFNVPDAQTLEALFQKSADNQQEVTDQLGYQVRRAVEVLIHSLDRADQDFGRELLAGIKEEVLYESALTVMMRLVFLFCAEERELIPSKPFPVYEQNYSVLAISKQLRELADQHGEELLERRYDAWPRLLAAFRAVFGGLRHDDVHIPAYGGSLFNPDRFPFLEGRKQGTSWRDTEAAPLPVNNRTILHLLEALQLLQVKVPGGGSAEARRLSFRALDIEQIGHVYEGLLDHTAKRAAEPFVGLVGTRAKEPEIPLAELEKLAAEGEKALLTFLKNETGRSEAAIKKALHPEKRDAEHEIKAEKRTTGKGAKGKRNSPAQAKLFPRDDQQQSSRLRTACQEDDALLKRVEPIAALIRSDTLGYPTVIPKGSVFVTAGTDRRSSGTHYTPRELTEPMVRHTLEPLVYVGPAEGKPEAEWKLNSAEQLLALKICDMACGSGAFLVQAARFMSERVLEAWETAKQLHPTSPGITPNGHPSTGDPNETLIPDDPGERKTYAMRLIAQRCLYGVDKNPLAAEMAKLSLWLLTLAKDKPFEFLDHSIRCGDSLVGLHDLAQLRHYSLRPNNVDQPLFSGPWLDGVKEAVNLRVALEDMPANTAEDVQRQEGLLIEANEQIARLRCAADLLVAAEFWGETAKDSLERTRHNANRSGFYLSQGSTDEFSQLAIKERKAQSMFHWPLEFPEVIVKQGGFDVFLGNPPFIGGRRIRSTLGKNYLEYLTTRLFAGSSGNADLCAFFFRRADQLLRRGGGFGLLATNTISQGDTRSTGLEYVVGNGSSIIRAIPSHAWPGDANLEVAHVWGHKGTWGGRFFLDGQATNGITAFLDIPGTVSGVPHRLRANASKSFQGSIVLGMGFVLSAAEAQSLKAAHVRNAEVLFPYLNGDDLNSRWDQSPSRWVINFFDWPIDRALQYPECFRIIEDRVKPERTRTTQGSDDFVLRKPLPQKWWIYADKRPELYRTIAAMQRVLVGVRHTKHHSVSFVRVGIVFSDATYVVSQDGDEWLAVLQSNIHEAWARQYSGSLETRLRYSPSDCFETFPFPLHMPALAPIGTAYDLHRRLLMTSTQQGLTEVYNCFHDASDTSTDAQELRRLQVEMDRAVADAYDWRDLCLGHGFHPTKLGIRFTISNAARHEILQRLLKLNHERYAEEVTARLHEKGEARTSLAKPKKAVTKPSSQPTLFDDATFPSTKLDDYVCGLVCELVKAVPGLPASDYIDSLVIALGYVRHKRLLTEKDQTHFAKLCKASPLASWSATDRIPWSELQDLLTRRKAIEPDDQTIQVGPELAMVRKSYPAVAPELVNLLGKAAAELRDLQSQANAQSPVQELSPEKAEMLRAFSHDRGQWFGVAA